MTMLGPGLLFAGRYVIEKHLADGGMGAVYVAQHRVTEERVALKILWPHVLASPEAVSRFQLEATVAAKVGSEHIVRVSDAGFEESLKMPFLVMELLHGTTLADLVEKHGPVDPVVSFELLRQTASALDRAHGYTDKAGKPSPIVHRDLKPENLFLTRRENGEPCVKILDFGIAKVLSENTKVSQDVKGTPLFMAYEQVASAPATPRTDIWPFGLIAFFLMTGKSYWMAASSPDAGITALFGEILAMPLPPASERLRELGAAQIPWPEAFDAWFLKCIDRNPRERFESAGAAMIALAEVLGKPMVSAAQLQRARHRVSNLVWGPMGNNQGLTGGVIPSQPPPGSSIPVPASTANPAPRRLELAASQAAVSRTTSETRRSSLAAAFGGAGALVLIVVVGAVAFLRSQHTLPAASREPASPVSVVASPPVLTASSVPSGPVASASASASDTASAGVPPAVSIPSATAGAKRPASTNRPPPTKKPGGQDSSHLYGER